MNRKIPVWVLLLVCFIAVNSTIVFGYLVRRELISPENSKLGRVGDVVLTISSYPQMVKQALTEIRPLILITLTGKAEDGSGAGMPQIIRNQFPRINGFKVNRSFQEGAMQDTGYILISTFSPAKRQSIVQLIRISDEKLIHEWAPKAPEYLKLHDKVRYRIMHPLLTDDGGLLFHGNTTSLKRIDSCSELVWEIKEAGFHHSNEKDSDGNYWIPTVITPSTYARKLTHPMPPFRDDAIAKVSPDGKLLFIKSVAEILEENNHPIILFGIATYNFPEWIHLNDVQPANYSTEYWEKGDLLLSLRDSHTVLLYRPNTNRILWSHTGPWMNQHDADFIDDSKIAIFGNDSVRRNGVKNDHEPDHIINGHNNIYIYDFAKNDISTPYSRIMEESDVRTYTEGLQEILADGDVFVEEQNRGRILRLSQTDLIWEYVFTETKNGIRMPSWSRYFTQAELDYVLPILENSNCEK